MAWLQIKKVKHEFVCELRATQGQVLLWQITFEKNRNFIAVKCTTCNARLNPSMFVRMNMWWIEELDIIASRAENSMDGFNINQWRSQIQKVTLNYCRSLPTLLEHKTSITEFNSVNTESSCPMFKQKKENHLQT